MSKIVEKMQAAVKSRFTKQAVRCPTLKQMAAFIKEQFGYQTTIEKVEENTDRKIGRLRRPGKGRVGNRLVVKHRGHVILDHNSAETYRHNTEVAEWILKKLEAKP